MNALTVIPNAEELCANRDAALSLYREALELLRDARKMHGQAAYYEKHLGKIPDLDHAFRYESKSIDSLMETITKDLDRDMWKSFMQGTALGAVMDKQERDALKASLVDPAPATIDNVRATMARLYGEADTIFRRGLVKAFEGLNRHYKSNDGFKLGERIILSWGCSYDKTIGGGWFRLTEWADTNLRDIDRVIHILDGKPQPENWTLGIAGRLYDAMRGMDNRLEGPRQTEVESVYWRAKFFKNGNIHLWLKDDGLRRRANKIIAEWYGEVIAAGHGVSRGARPASTMADAFTAQDLDYFATPDAAAEMVMTAADIRPGHMVLEPSAGEGALAVKAALASEERVTAVEKHSGRLEALGKLSGILNVIEGDFLSMPAVRAYDRIVMNPPFSKGQDFIHVRHALGFLKKGGRLVAIMAAGVEYRACSEAASFRDMVYQMGGTIELMPEGSFKASGTGVATALVTIDA